MGHKGLDLGSTGPFSKGEGGGQPLPLEYPTLQPILAERKYGLPHLARIVCQQWILWVVLAIQFYRLIYP